MDFLLVLAWGFLAGVLVNALADELPYRRKLALPRYPDGTPRPFAAWSGISAFMLGQRAPAQPQPDTAYYKQGFDTPKLSWRYPLTELLCIGLMSLVYFLAPNIPNITLEQTLLYYIYMAIFALIIVIDMEHKLILFVVVLPAMGLAILDALLLPQPSPNIRDALVGAAIGFVVFFVMYQGGFIFTYIMGMLRGERINTVAFGYGDVMLITLSGLLLGMAHTIIALFITVFLGALGALGYMVLKLLLRGRYHAFTAIPYGPYIIIATLIMLLYGDPVRISLLGY